MERLVVVLQLPDKIKADNGIVEDRVVAMCMLLARLAYPNRLSDLWFKYGWSPERVSRISSTVQLMIHDRWHHLLQFDSARLTPEKLEQYARAVHAKGAPLDSVWGFIDGTVRAIARPVRHQRAVYNGWKRKHCLKYHAIVTPDGLISHLFGPIDGRRNDSYLLNESGLLNYLERHAYNTNGIPLQLYGDPAYSVNRYLLSPYQGARITREQRAWNKAMSKVRIVVEWAFKEVISLFGFLDFPKNQKHLLQPVGLQFRVAVLLHNAHVILHRPQIAQYFDIDRDGGPEDYIEQQLIEPPSLDSYFHN